MLSGTSGAGRDKGAASAMTTGAGDETSACCLHERGARLARGFAADTGAARLVVSTDALIGAGGADATPAGATGAPGAVAAGRLFERGLARGFAAAGAAVAVGAGAAGGPTERAEGADVAAGASASAGPDGAEVAVAGAVAEATGADADTGAIAGAGRRRGGIAPTTQARQTREAH